jgi:SAM-dependent methyltransferase
VADLRSAIEQGHYARKQMFSRDCLVAWSHRRRFRTALALAERFRGKRVLDYGCGDGTFIALTLLGDSAPAAAVGVELSSEMVEECRSRYRGEPRLQFLTTGELDAAGERRRYDAVFCMEVLEHVINWEPELKRLAQLVAPDGCVIISVPVETGIPLVVKQIVRRIAGWRNIGHYPGTSGYSLRELISAVFAGAEPHMPRPVFPHLGGDMHDHKGFNWMVLRRRIEREFVMERLLASPFTWLTPHLGTQAWFVLRPRRAAMEGAGG